MLATPCAPKPRPGLDPGPPPHPRATAAERSRVKPGTGSPEQAKGGRT